MPGSLFIQKSAARPLVIAPAVRAAVAAQLMAVPPNDLASTLPVCCIKVNANN